MEQLLKSLTSNKTKTNYHHKKFYKPILNISNNSKLINIIIRLINRTLFEHYTYYSVVH